MNTIYKILAVASVVLLFSCASDSSPSKKAYENTFGKWEVSQDSDKDKKVDPKSEPVKDQLLFQVKAKGSDSAIEEKNFPKIMSTCVQIAKSQAGFILMQGVFLNYLVSANKTETGSVYLLGKNNSEEYRCNFTITDKTVISECKGDVKGIQNASCAPLSQDPNNKDYGYCTCGFRWNFEGGEKSLNKAIRVEQ